MASNEETDVFIICKICDLPFTSDMNFEEHLKGKKHKKQVEHKKRPKEKKSLDGDSCLEEVKDSDGQGYICEVCETFFSGHVPYNQHLKSGPHGKALRRKKIKDDAALLEDVDSDSKLPDNVDLQKILKQILPQVVKTCVICEKDFYGPESYAHHMKSKYHGRRRRELQLFKKIKAVLTNCEGSDWEELCEDEEKEEAAKWQQSSLKCKDCDKIFSNAFHFAQHMLSKIHRKRERQNRLLNELKAIKAIEIENDSSLEEMKAPLLTCEACSKFCCCPESLKAPFKSKGHHRVMKSMKCLTKKDKTSENRRDKRSVDDAENCNGQETSSSAKNESTETAVREDGDEH